MTAVGRSQILNEHEAANTRANNTILQDDNMHILRSLRVGPLQYRSYRSVACPLLPSAAVLRRYVGGGWEAPKWVGGIAPINKSICYSLGDVYRLYNTTEQDEASCQILSPYAIHKLATTHRLQAVACNSTHRTLLRGTFFAEPLNSGALNLCKHHQAPATPPR